MTLEIQTRPLTDSDRADLAVIMAGLRSAVDTRMGGRQNDALYVAIGAALVGGVAAAIGRKSLLISCLVTGTIAFVFWLMARRDRQKLLNTALVESQPDWTQVREIRIRPRELILVNDALLFRTDGPESFLVTTEALGKKPEELARSNVTLRQLWPNGGFLPTLATGNQVPSRTISGDSWQPPDDFDEDDGVIPTSKLPVTS